MNSKWPTVSLRKALTPISRSESVDPERTYHILGAHWYAEGLYTKEIAKGSLIRASKVYRIEQGDFVYNRLFAWKGSFAVATEENHGCYVSNEFPAFAINSDLLDPQYLWRYFSRASTWEEALGLSTGGTPTSRNRLKEEKLLAMEIPLPPIEEQRRIVARIEELAARIEEARELRRRAVEETGALLIVASKRFFSQNNVQKPKKELKDLATRITKGESPEWQGFTYQDDGPQFVRSENVLWGRLDLSKRISIPIEFHKKLNRSQLRPGDVLINLVGASIGRSCVVPSSLGDANINQAVAVISPNFKLLDSEYLMHFLLSAPAQEIIHGGKVETARPNISLSDIRNLVLPVPSLTEQRSIINYLKGLQSKLDALRRHQAETAAALEALLPAVLERGFRGEL